MLATASVFAETLKVWGHISRTTGPIGLKLWIWCCGFPNNMYTKFHYLRRSGLINTLGDLTQNDPILEWTTSLHTNSRTLFVFRSTSRRTSSYVITSDCY